MNKDQMIKWSLIVGGGVLAYWYVTNYGPNGHVSTGTASWWDTWFGAGTPAPVARQTTTTNTTGAATQPATATQPTTQAVVTQPSYTAPVVTVNQDVKQQVVAASGVAGANQPGSAIQGGYAVPDIWSYFWQQVTGKTITPQQMGQMFPTSAPLTVDQFMAALPTAGLSGIGAVVSVPSAPSLPSMSFGGSFRRPGMRGMGGRGSGMGGPTIQ
jgi:hypothetical protein